MDDANDDWLQSAKKPDKEEEYLDYKKPHRAADNRSGRSARSNAADQIV